MIKPIKPLEERVRYFRNLVKQRETSFVYFRIFYPRCCLTCKKFETCDGGLFFLQLWLNGVSPFGSIFKIGATCARWE